ncbi:MAG: hypothetical protein JOY58_18090 [Solirubrobacterales bacterium]|nr:hypothetical protein [Solirubrobacterales bacterium]
MHSALHQLLLQARSEELARAGERHRRAREAGPRLRQISDASPVTLRFAFPDDELALSRLAQLDSSVPPASPVLVAEVNGELRAALSIADGAVVADPLYRTAQLVTLLRARAEHLTGSPDAGASGTGRLRGWARAIYAGGRLGG